MMVFFLSNMIENQCMSTGAFEITLNGKVVFSKLWDVGKMELKSRTNQLKCPSSLYGPVATKDGSLIRLGEWGQGWLCLEPMVVL